MNDKEQVKRKAIVYIDGFNLYFAIKEKNWDSLLWLDLVKLAKTLVRPDQELVRVKYFTSRIKNDVAKQIRQNAYLDALETLDSLDIYYGDYQKNEVLCFDCGKTWRNDNEKQTDVNLAVHMLVDSHNPGFVDDIILVTADSDQCPSMAAVQALGIDVLVVLPPGRGHYIEIQRAANSRLELTKRKLRESQLPDEIKGKNGFSIKKPERYK